MCAFTALSICWLNSQKLAARLRVAATTLPVDNLMHRMTALPTRLRRGVNETTEVHSRR